MVMGSSFMPGEFISCRMALPEEVVRSVTWRVLPCMLWEISAGVVVTLPCHSPVRVFMRSKVFCAGDWATVVVEKVERRAKTRTGTDVRLRVRMFELLCGIASECFATVL